jgi:hypothetical protein
VAYKPEVTYRMFEMFVNAQKWKICLYKSSK